MAIVWPGQMLTLGKNIILGIADGIKSAPKAVWNALKGVVLDGISGVKSWLGLGGSNGNSRKIQLAGARARGGPVSGGKAYLVGEDGPEIFIPRVSGGITPNHKIGLGSIPRIAALLSAPAALSTAHAANDAPKANPLPKVIVTNTVKPAGTNSARSSAPITLAPTFHIKQQPGEDAEALAERIMKIMKREAEAARGSDYEDDF